MTEKKEATQKCPHCYTDIDARATVCPQCGRDINPKTPKNKKPLWQFGTFVMAFGLVCVVVSICGFLFLDLGSISIGPFMIGLIAMGLGAFFRVFS